MENSADVKLHLASFVSSINSDSERRNFRTHTHETPRIINILVANVWKHEVHERDLKKPQSFSFMMLSRFPFQVKDENGLNSSML